MDTFIKFPFGITKLAVGIVTCKMVDHEELSPTNTQTEKTPTQLKAETTQELLVRHDKTGEKCHIYLGDKLFYARPRHRLALIYIGRAGNATNIRQWLIEMKPEVIRVHNITLQSWVEVRNSYWIYKNISNSLIWKIFTNGPLHTVIVPFVLFINSCPPQWALWQIFDYIPLLFASPTKYVFIWGVLAFIRAVIKTKSIEKKINKIIQGSVCDRSTCLRLDKEIFRRHLPTIRLAAQPSSINYQINNY
jgi:hypothetical protein